jgi:Copper amine oxidase N-terminal domain
VLAALTFATFAITLNGTPVLPHARAAVAGGHVLLPVRALGEALGADVGYDGRAHRIVVQRGSRVATLPAGGSVRIAGGHAYAPLRAAASAFGLDVAYLAASRTVALADRTVASTDRTVASTPSTPGAVLYTAAPNSGAAGTSGLTYAVSTTPGRNADVHDPYPAISARFAGASAIDRNSLRVLLDGRDVSAEAAVVGDQVLLTPRAALLPGRHDVYVTARTPEGHVVDAAWSFNDTFAFSTAPPPTPFPISAIYLDRYITPGTNAFDVVVRGVPGMTGAVAVDGVGTAFPLQVAGYDTYVAHVFVPPGVFQPNANIAARIVFPNGNVQTIILPQTIPLVTVTPTPYPLPKPTPTPRPRRSIDIPATPPPRVPLAATPTPVPRPTATPAPTPRPTAKAISVPLRASTPKPSASPAPAEPIVTPMPSPTPSPTPHRRPPLAKPRLSPIPTNVPG